MFRAEAKQHIAEELARGAAAREAGFEGRARVCARRAAGAAVREYLELRGAPNLMQGGSAYDLLVYMRDLAESGMGPAGPGIRQRVDYLLVRVNEAYALPVDVNLLAEASGLVDDLESLLSEGSR